MKAQQTQEELFLFFFFYLPLTYLMEFIQENLLQEGKLSTVTIAYMN